MATFTIKTSMTFLEDTRSSDKIPGRITLPAGTKVSVAKLFENTRQKGFNLSVYLGGIRYTRKLNIPKGTKNGKPNRRSPGL